MLKNGIEGLDKVQNLKISIPQNKLKSLLSVSS